MTALSSGCPLELFLGCGLIGRAVHISPSEFPLSSLPGPLRTKLGAVLSFISYLITPPLSANNNQINKIVGFPGLFLSFQPLPTFMFGCQWGCVVQNRRNPFLISPGQI